MKCFQVWVSSPGGDTARKVQSIETYLQMFGSLPEAPDGKVVSNEDGTVEIRSFNEAGFSMTKNLLKDKGFVIEREQVNE